MSDAATALVAALEAATADQPKMPLLHHRVEAYQDELSRLRGRTDADGRWDALDPTSGNRRQREIRKILDEQAPKPITGPRRDTVHRLLERVKTEIIQPAMLPQSVMRHSPSGAVGEFQRREGHPFYKRAVLAFKRGIAGIEPDNPDPDLRNPERFRPAGTGPNGASAFMVDAVIPGNFAFGAQAKANWPLGEPTADTAQKQAERRERLAAETREAHEAMAQAVARTREEMERQIEQKRRDIEELERIYAATPEVPDRPAGALAVEPERQGREQRRLQREAHGNGHRKSTTKAREKRPATPAQLAALARAQEARRAKRAAAAQGTALSAAEG